VYVVRLSDQFAQSQRDWIVREMTARGIGCGRYFAPIHQQSIYSDASFQRMALPVTEWNAARTLALPFFNRIEDSQLEEVCHTLEELIYKAGQLTPEKKIAAGAS
jgi:perosamine synthetase